MSLAVPFSADQIMHSVQLTHKLSMETLFRVLWQVVLEKLSKEIGQLDDKVESTFVEKVRGDF